MGLMIPLMFNTILVVYPPERRGDGLRRSRHDVRAGDVTFMQSRKENLPGYGRPLGERHHCGRLSTRDHQRVQ
jgi:hypothetical protein